MFAILTEYDVLRVQHTGRSDADCLLTGADPTQKDETGAFYIAQMIHYGLRPLKSKLAAKKASLEAFGDKKTLRVPKRLLGLEEDLKEKWKDVCKREGAQVKGKTAQVRYKNWEACNNSF